MTSILTSKAIERAKPKRDNHGNLQRAEYPDGGTGLYLVVQPSGVKSWAVRYRMKGFPKKLTLEGRYPAVSLKAARDKAGKALDAIEHGRDPASDKRAKKALPPSEDGIEHVVTDFLRQHVDRKNRESTARETRRIFETYVLPKWQGRRVQDIEKHDIVKLLDDIAERAPTMANRTLAAIRKFFNWVCARTKLTSPCAGVEPPGEDRQRDRVLTDRELKALWVACGEIGWPFGPIVRLLALTGQRRDEVAGMSWREVDLKARLWSIPRERAKNDKATDVPLSDQAISVLKALPKESDGLIFSVTGTTAVSGFSRAKARIDSELPGSEPWVLHDLRRTFATRMAKLNVPIHVVEAILNHKAGAIRGVAAVYNRFDYADEKRRALELWGAYVQDLIEPKPSNVVSLGRK